MNIFHKFFFWVVHKSRGQPWGENIIHHKFFCLNILQFSSILQKYQCRFNNRKTLVCCCVCLYLVFVIPRPKTVDKYYVLIVLYSTRKNYLVLSILLLLEQVGSKYTYLITYYLFVIFLSKHQSGRVYLSIIAQLILRQQTN